MKLSIIIPVYNEENTIAEILNKVRVVDLGDVEKEVIVVDDCSTDGTRKILSENAAGIKLLFHDRNFGKGRAIRTGLAEATGDYFIVQDADLEYDPQDFKPMLQRMRQENLEVLYGSRRLKKENVQHSGVIYYFGGWVLTVLANILYGQHLTDEPTCYKMFKMEFIKKLPLKSERFEFCPEVTALIALRGIKIKEIPISYFPRHKKEGKKIGWRDELQAIWVLLKNWF
ncbi:MAG: glycosyltransferase family 2 protein [Patescibacteria group bacterium]